MKNLQIYVKILLHFAKLKVADLIPFAKGISAKAAIDPDVPVDPGLVGQLNGNIKDLEATVVARESDTSISLTKTEGKQTTALIRTLTKVSTVVEEGANDLTPGDVTAIQIIITRIGFRVYKVRDIAGRFFEIFKTLIATVYIRVKADKTINLYQWRWSLDEITWIRLDDTTVASIIIFGLPSGKTVFFQYAVSLKVKGVPKISAVPTVPEWGDSISELIP